MVSATDPVSLGCAVSPSQSSSVWRHEQHHPIHDYLPSPPLPVPAAFEGTKGKFRTREKVVARNTSAKNR